METAEMYHYQASVDPYAKSGEGYVYTANLNDIMDAYNEYLTDREEN